MTATEAQKRAVKKYLQKMAEIKIRMSEEEKDQIKQAADTEGLSVNSFIMQAISEYIENHQ